MPTVQQRARTRAATRAARENKIAMNYDAAGNGRRVVSWQPSSAGPIRMTENTDRMRDRARDTARNDWAGASTSQKWTTNLVGLGITPRWASADDNDAFAEWVPQCDADSVLDFYAMQALGVRTWFVGGEAFVRRRRRRLDAPLSTPLQIQLLSSAMVPRLTTSGWEGLPAKHEIVQGIERHASYGNRTAIWFYRSHPGDGALGKTPTINDLVRVPISEVRHIVELTEPGQMRGVSGMHAVMVKLRQAMNYEDVVLDRQTLANMFVAFIQRQLPDQWEQSGIKLDENGMPAAWSDDGRPVVLGSGNVQELNPGETATFSNPPEAGTTYSDYMRTTHLGSAAGTGLPYEVMSGDIRDISDRTLRVVMQEFRRFCQQRQWHMVIPMFCQPAVEWWAESRVLAGKARASELPRLRKPEWAPHGWDYLHPTQDVQGKIMAIDKGLESVPSIIGQRGDDWRKTLKQRAEYKAAEKAAGLAPEPEPAPKPGPAPAPKPAPQASQTEGLMQMLAQQQAMTLELVSAVSALVKQREVTP